MMNNDPFYRSDFEITKKQRGLPFVTQGMRVEMDGRPGFIVTANSSGHFVVRFDDGTNGPCHPRWRMKYFAKDGSLILDTGD